MSRAGYWESRWTGFRRGSERIELAWEGGIAEARLYVEGAPLITRAVLDALPITLPVMHVAWSGDMLMGVKPIALGVPTAENDVRMPQPGDIAWDPKVRELTFTYGVAECHSPAGPNTIAVFGQIERGLEEFAVFGRNRRYDGVGDLVLRRP